MKVHITGGKGFLGTYIARALARSHEVELSDIGELDVGNLEAVATHFTKSKPDIIVHLAGLTGAQASRQHPHEYFRINCVGTLNVMEACRVAGVDKVVFMSTLTVHGATRDSSMEEQSSYDPMHPYAGSKAAAELVVKAYAKSYGIKAVTLRATLIAGEGQKEPNAVTEFVQSALNEGPLEIHGDGTHQREWLHPIDLAEAVRAAVTYLAEKPDVVCETFIISSGLPLSMLELAERVVSVLGRGKIEFRSATGQTFSLCSRPSKVKDTLGWIPAITIDEIIRRIVNDRRLVPYG